MGSRSNLNATSTLDISEELLADGAVVLFKLAGTIDANTFEHLERTLETAFARHIVRIIVDMSGVREISSSGTGVFVSAFSQARDQQGNMVLFGVSKGVQEVFDILGLTGQLPVAADRDGALAVCFSPAGASGSTMAVKVPDSGAHSAISTTPGFKF